MGESVLGIRIFQPFAQFRNPLTFYYAQTYPLPPKTTLIGFFQNFLGKYYDYDLWNMKLSIHGGFSSFFWNYQNLIKGDISLNYYNGRPMLFNQNLPLYHFPIKSQRSPVYQQELFNGHYFIFLKYHEDIIDDILNKLRNPPFVLRIGRSEDVIFVKEIYVEGKNLDFSEKAEKVDYLYLKYPTYLIYDDFDGKKLKIEKVEYPVYYMPIEIKYIYEDEEKQLSSIGELLLLKEKIERIPKFAKIIYLGAKSEIEFDEDINCDKIKIVKYDGEEEEFLIPHVYGWL